MADPAQRPNNGQRTADNLLGKLGRLLGLAAVAVLPLAAQAQLLLSNAAPATENFDGLGAAAGAVPVGFQLSGEAAPTYGSAANYTATTAAAAGNNFTAGGTYNFGAAAGASDRALGFLTSGSYTSPRHILLAVKNTTGAVLQALNVQFDLEKYRSGSRAYSWTFYTSPDGVAWTAQPAGDQTFPADANNTVYTYPPATTTKQVALAGLQVAAAATYYLRWSDVGVGGSTNGQALALDNVVLTPTLVSGPNDDDSSTRSISTAPAAYDSPYCLSGAGSASFAVAYTASGPFTGLFKAQLSDAAGVFPENPADNIIGSGPTSPIAATLPANTPSGRGYRIRVLNDAPLTYGADNGRDLIVNQAPASNAVALAPAASQTVTTTSTGAALTATAEAPSSWAWLYGLDAAGPFTTTIAGASAATYRVKGADFPAAGTYYLIAQATTACGAVTGQSAPVAIAVVAPPPADPALTVSLTALPDFGSVAAGAAATPKSLVVSGTNLAGPVLITPPAGFEIRTGDQPFSCCALELTPANGTLDRTLIDVRFVPTAAQPYAATLPVSSADGTGKSVALSGTGVAPVYPATVSSAAVTALTPTSAATGGTVAADGGSAVVARGVVWGKTSNPTLSAGKTADGAGPGTFASALTGLLPGTTYYARAYATNAVGTTYGEEMAFTTGAVPLAPEPTGPATLTAGPVSSHAIQLNLKGGGAKRLVLARSTGAVDAVPVDATAYAAGPFGQGSRIGTGNYVVYNGADTTVAVTNLQAGTTYTFAVFAYNDNDTPYAENYLTTAPGTLTQATPAAPAALLLEENFAYPAGAALADSNWVAHSGGTTNAVTVAPGGLSYAGYNASGVGNAAALVASGQDVSRPFATVAPHTPVYASFLVNVADAATAGDYFLHLGPTPLSSNFRSRVFVRKNAATNKVQFGISGSAAATYTTTEYDLATTYLLVVKYSFDETGNLSQLFVNPTPAAEPAVADASSAEAGSTSPANIGTVALRQGTNSPNLVIDGLRVGTSYAVVLTGQACQAPALAVPVVPVADATAGLRGASVAFAAVAAGSAPLTLTYAITKNGASTPITSPYVFAVGTTVVTATATNACGTSTKDFSVTVRPPTAVSVLYQNADSQVADNVIRPTLQLVNNGPVAIPYAELSVRYWLTAEDFAPITATVDWAQLGTRAVAARYVALAQPAQGAFGYVEYRFAAAGSLAVGGSTGPIQSRINKQTYTNFDEADDYSYAANRTFLKNERITVYRGGVLIGGAEPALAAATVRLQAWSQNWAPGPADNTISTSLHLRNVGNQPVRYADLTARYWFSPEGPPALRAYVDYAELGSPNVAITFGQAGTEAYAEVHFAAALGELAPLNSTGNVQYRLAKADWSPFNQTNDFSYRPAGPLAENSHFTVYQQGQLVYGQEPAGATAGSASQSRAAAAPVAPGLAPAQAQPVSSYPNPFTGSTTLAFALERSEAYELAIYDANGRLIERLRTGQARAGELVRVPWPAAVPAGLYVARLTTGTAVQYVKLVRQ